MDTNQLARDHTRLVNKIVAQVSRARGFKSDSYTREDMLSAAWEGVARAIYKYDPQKSEQTFTQYCAYQIYYAVIQSSYSEASLVRMSNYMVNRARDGKADFATIIHEPQDNGEEAPRSNHRSIYKEKQEPSATQGELYDYLKDTLKDHFDEVTMNMFFMYYGLCGYDITKGRSIARKFHLSPGRTSQKIKSVVEYLKKDDIFIDLMNELHGV